MTGLASPRLFAQAPSTDTTSLRTAVNGRFEVGVAVSEPEFRGNDPRRTRLIVQHFTSVTAENALKWKNIATAPGRYDFSGADSYIAFAERNRLAPTGHTLVWASGTPDWVFRDSGGRTRTRAEVLHELKDYITTVVGRYQGRIKSWDVVNEALREDGRLRATPWLSALGDEYILMAFRFARQADPQAQLYINEQGLEEPRKLAGMVRLLQRLKSAGVRVDAVGIQGHYYLESPNPEGLDTAITTLARLGYQVLLTELDIDVLPHQRGLAARLPTLDRTTIDPYRSGLPDSVQVRLAAQYAEIIRIVLRHPGTVSRVTFWGVDDGASWRNNFPVHGRINHPLLFDRQGSPKAAYWAVIAALVQHR